MVEQVGTDLSLCGLFHEPHYQAAKQIVENLRQYLEASSLIDYEQQFNDSDANDVRDDDYEEHPCIWFREIRNYIVTKLDDLHATPPTPAVEERRFVLPDPERITVDMVTQLRNMQISVEERQQKLINQNIIKVGFANKFMHLEDDESGEMSLCSICIEHPYEPENIPHMIQIVNCGHLFHSRCLAQCVQTSSKRCPLCRADIAELEDAFEIKDSAVNWKEFLEETFPDREDLNNDEYIFRTKEGNWKDFIAINHSEQPSEEVERKEEQEEQLESKED